MEEKRKDQRKYSKFYKISEIYFKNTNKLHTQKPQIRDLQINKYLQNNAKNQRWGRNKGSEKETAGDSQGGKAHAMSSCFWVETAEFRGTVPKGNPISKNPTVGKAVFR